MFPLWCNEHLDSKDLSCSFGDFLSTGLDIWGSPMLAEWMNKRKHAATKSWSSEPLQAIEAQQFKRTGLGSTTSSLFKSANISDHEPCVRAQI